ncbi:MAG: glycosyltransferase family 2 protein [bacterium]
MLISILIPCYNAAPWLANCIESALAQTYPHTEIILLVDEGSTDGSLQIAPKYSNRIMMMTSPHQDQQATRNQLFALSHGEWIQWLDADDELLPEKIEKHLQFALAQQADAVYGDYFFGVYENGKHLLTKRHSPPDSFVKALLNGREGLAPNSVFLWRRAMLETIKKSKGQVWSTAPQYLGGSNNGAVLCFEAVSLGAKLVKMSEPLTLYRSWSPYQTSRRKRAERRQVADLLAKMLPVEAA